MKTAQEWHYNKYIKGYDDERDGIKQRFQDMEEYAKEYAASQSKWISVDNPPQIGEEVFIYAEVELIISGDIVKKRILGTRLNSGWFTKSLVIIIKAISWQPLPTPPEK